MKIPNIKVDNLKVKFKSLKFLIILAVVLGLVVSFLTAWLVVRSQTAKKAGQQPNQISQALRDELLATARIELPKYVKQALNPNLMFVTANIKPYQTFTFTDTWSLPDNKKLVAFVRLNSAKQVLDKNLVIFLTDRISNPSGLTTSQLTQQFLLLNPQGDWKCEILNSSTKLCENFWTDKSSGAKQGVGVIVTSASSQLFSCERELNSELYKYDTCSSLKIKDEASAGIPVLPAYTGKNPLPVQKPLSPALPAIPAVKLK